MSTVEIMSFINSFIISQLIFWILKQRKQIKELKAEKETIEHSNERWENFYKSRISSLQGQIDRLSKMKTIQNPNLPKDAIQAVEYAMKHAHPDNGGSAEDFMKFQKCYEELTRKEINK